MTEPVDKKKRETPTQRLARLGFKVDPTWKQPTNRFALSKRYRRDLDEITLSKPNTDKTE